MPTPELNDNQLREVEREAREIIVHRTKLGALTYPLTAGLLGWVADFHHTQPVIFLSFIATQLVLGISRLVLIRHFDRLYRRTPRIWPLLFRPVFCSKNAPVNSKTPAMLSRQQIGPRVFSSPT